jgi:class 3 adenylate cyclase/tetratricopeptide (TPR) repeat protein
VLFADIAGYTAQCARNDPEQVQAMLGRFFDAMDRVITTYGGNVIDRIGDAVMAVFGAPVAHGNDDQRAIRAALDMHSTATGLFDCEGQPLRLHIGIANGELVAAAIGGGGTSKYSVTGEAVNLAARLDALASPGETLISQELHDSVSATVEADALGECAIKGLAAPVSVWKLRGLHATIADRSPLVGRQAELAQLVATLDAVRDNGTGMLVVVRGEAGIGKTRLIGELRERAKVYGFDAPLGQVLDFGVGRGQDAVPMVLKSVLEIPGPADESLRRAAVSRAVDNGLIQGDEQLFVNEWFDLSQPSALKAIFDAMDNTTRVRRSGETLAGVLQRAAKVQPRLVSIEDIHWASADLLRYLAAIARAATQAPLILILTSRIEGNPLDNAWRSACRACPMLTIDLAPLRDQDAQLLASALVKEWSQFARQCVERAEGNPMFLVQLLRSAGELRAPGIVPPTIQSLVLARMDRLSEPDRVALQAAAVIGKRFSLDDLRAVADQPRYRCDALLAADLVRPDDQSFLFAHALIQEAAYSSTLKSRRRQLHLRAAERFGEGEPILRAEHLDRAGDPGASQAYLTAAIAEAERFRYDTALSLAERGAKLASTHDVGCSLTLLSGELMREKGMLNDSIAAFQAALDLAQHDVQRCHAWMGVAAGHRLTGAIAQGMEALGQAQLIAERLDLTVECSRIHHARGNLFFAQGDGAACEAEHKQALGDAQKSLNAECELQALSGIGDAHYAQGRMLTALGYFRRCVDLCHERGWIRLEVPNRSMVSACLWHEDVATAALEAQRACADAQRIGMLPLQIFPQTGLAMRLSDAARFDEAEQACIRGLALARAVGSGRYESLLLWTLATVRLRQGRRDEARQHLRPALALARQTGLGFFGAPIYGSLAWAASDPGERQRSLLEGEALLLERCMAHCHLWFYTQAIEATVAAVEWDRASQYADALEAFVRAEPLPSALLIAARARALRDVAHGNDRLPAMSRLRHVRDDIASAGMAWALNAIDAALILE